MTSSYHLSLSAFLLASQRCNVAASATIVRQSQQRLQSSLCLAKQRICPITTYLPKLHRSKKPSTTTALNQHSCYDGLTFQSSNGNVSRREFTTNILQASLLSSPLLSDGGETTAAATTDSDNKQDVEFNEDVFRLPKVPDRIKLSPGQRLVAIGDVHGDYEQLCRMLRVANVMDDNLNWAGGSNTICIQCGDVLDRGPAELSSLRLLTNLAQQCHDEKNGDSMLSMLYGNHETMYMEGYFQYAWDGHAKKEFDEYFGSPLDKYFQDSSRSAGDWKKLYLDNEPSRWLAYEPGGILSKPLLSNMKVAIIVGRSVLVHAGLTKNHLDDYKGSIEEINRTANEWILKPTPIGGCEGTLNALNKLSKLYLPKNNAGENPIYDEYLKHIGQYRAYEIARTMPSCLGGGPDGGQESPVWMRQYSSPGDASPTDKKLAQETLDTVLAELDVDRMIMGHTPQKRINVALHSKAWRIDIGASRGISQMSTPNPVEVLEVVALENGKEEVSILTEAGRIRAHERQV